MEKAPENSSVPWVAVMEGLTGVTLDDIIDSLPKGSTPNRYKPHQGKRERTRRQRQIERGLPEGVRLFNGELQLCCCVCDRWYESPIGLSDIQTDYDPDSSYCGSSPRCCP